MATTGYNPGGDQRIIWLVRCWLINVFWFLCCALIFYLISASLVCFFTYADHVFWSKNVVWPTQPHVRISTCMLFIHLNWHMSALWKWQVRARSTPGSAADRDPHLLAPPCSSLHLHTNSLPFFLPPRLSTPHDALPMMDYLMLGGKSLPTRLPPYPRNYSV